MSEHVDLTASEQRIADELGNVLDMAARLITGPISKSYFDEKFSNLLRSATALASEIEIDSVGRSTAGSPAWDHGKVWDTIVGKYSAPGFRLDQVWTALEHENDYYSAETRTFNRTAS